MTKKDDISLLPAYLTVGEDKLKRTTVAKRLRTRLEKRGDLAFNSDKFDGETATGQEIVDAANTLPFASEVRLVEVSNVDKLKKADSEMLVTYLASPCATTVMLLDAEKLAKTTRLYKAIAKVGKSAVIPCTQPKNYELITLVKKLAKQYGTPFSEGAARKLVELVGNDTSTLDAQVRKVTLAHAGSNSVLPEDVEAIVVRTSEVKPWELTDALAARNVAKCLTSLSQLTSISPYQLLPQSVNRIRELICVKCLEQRGTTGNLAQEIGELRGRGVQAWQIKNHGSWARKWTMDELTDALKRAVEAERAMKSGTDPEAAYRDWLLQTLAK